MTNTRLTGSNQNNPSDSNISNFAILELLELQLDNYSDLKSLTIKLELTPATVLLPQTIRQISDELLIDNSLVYDCLNFLDVIKLYSSLTYGNPEKFTDYITSILTENRTVLDPKRVISSETIDDFLFSSEEELTKFLLNNKVFISIYVYVLCRYILF